MEEIFENITPEQFKVINHYCNGIIFHQEDEEKKVFRIKTSSKYAKEVINQVIQYKASE